MTSEPPVPSEPLTTPHDRRVSWRRRLLVTAVTAVAILAVDVGAVSPRPATAATIPTEPSACFSGWQEMPIPAASFESTPFEILSRKGQPAWVLGGSADGVLALKWDGSRWKRAATNSSGRRGIGGAVVTGKSKVLAVGYERPLANQENGALEPSTGRIVGSRWRGRRGPRPPGVRSTLTDVTALPGGRAWAVGTRHSGGRLRAYAVRWTGSSWARSDPASGPGAGLLGVDRAKSGTVWAVGWRESRLGRPRPLIAQRQGSRWKTTRGADLPAGSAVFTGVDFTPGTGGWAVGYFVPKGTARHKAILQRRVDGKWKNVDLPWADVFQAVPRSITVGNGEIWISGQQAPTANRDSRGFMAHRKGGVWTISVLGHPADIASEVMDVARTSTGAIAAAKVGASLVVLRTCGGSIQTAAGGKRRIKVSNIAARRAASEADPLHGEVVSATPATAIAGDVVKPVKLAAPSALSGLRIRNVTEKRGLKLSTTTYGGFSADFDDNGRPDIFYSRHGKKAPRLALNKVSGFKTAPKVAYSSLDRHGCAAADVNADGEMDVLCAVGGARGKTLHRHELSLSPATDHGELALDMAGLLDPSGRGRDVAFLHLDDDEYPEAFVINEPERNDGMPGANRFYRNIGGTFASVPEVGLDATHGGLCVVTGDLDGDGDDDLAYCTKYQVGSRAAGLRFMRNEDGKLRDRTRGRGIKPIGDIDVAFADVTGDGRKDLIQLSPNRLRVSRWSSSGYKTIYQARITKGQAIAAGDANGDGKADIYLARGGRRGNAPDRLLISRQQGRKFKSVKIPVTSKGSADDVFSLDHDGNGLDDFFVLNGRKGPGPVQLLASFKVQ